MGHFPSTNLVNTLSIRMLHSVDPREKKSNLILAEKKKSQTEQERKVIGEEIKFGNNENFDSKTTPLSLFLFSFETLTFAKRRLWLFGKDDS